jgi:serine/threonine protein kinase
MGSMPQRWLDSTPVMHLAAGQTVSFYEILGSLGVGAMGEVYRAKDTRLDREVAIKGLLEHLAEEEKQRPNLLLALPLEWGSGAVT